jgi:hypothetical protein
MKRELLVGTGLWTILFLSCFARYFILPEYWRRNITIDELLTTYY